MKQTDSCRGWGGLDERWGDSVSHRHRHQCGDGHRERGMGVGGGRQRGKNGTKRDLAWGDGLMMQCVDDVLKITKIRNETGDITIGLTDFLKDYKRML